MNNLNIIIQRYLLDRYNTGSLVFLPTRSFYSYQQGAFIPTNKELYKESLTATLFTISLTIAAAVFSLTGSLNPSKNYK